MKASDVRAALRAYYWSGQWLLAFEVGDDTGSRVRRWADAVAWNAWPSRGHEIHGVEIKVSKSDLTCLQFANRVSRHRNGANHMTYDPFAKCRRDLGVIIDKHDEICRMQDRALKITADLFLAIGGMTAVAIAVALPGIAARTAVLSDGADSYGAIRSRQKVLGALRNMASALGYDLVRRSETFNASRSHRLEFEAEIAEIRDRQEAGR